MFTSILRPAMRWWRATEIYAETIHVKHATVDLRGFTQCLKDLGNTTSALLLSPASKAYPVKKD